jgi:hypothetical protein
MTGIASIFLTHISQRFPQHSLPIEYGNVCTHHVMVPVCLVSCCTRVTNASFRHLVLLTVGSICTGKLVERLKKHLMLWLGSQYITILFHDRHPCVS